MDGGYDITYLIDDVERNQSSSYREHCDEVVRRPVKFWAKRAIHFWTMFDSGTRVAVSWI